MTNARPSSMPGGTSPRWPAAGFLATRGRRGIVLLIAKLERPARNVALVCRLPEAGVEFIAADIPTVHKLTINTLAAVADEEARMTSARMKAALATAQARGVRPSNPHQRPGTREQAFVANRVAAKVHPRQGLPLSRNMAPVIRLTRAGGATSLAAIAPALTAQGVASLSGRGGCLIRTILNPQSGTNRQQHA